MPAMRALFIAGLILIALGIASLFVPIPRRERHGFEAGPVSVGFETTRKKVVPRAVSAVLIGGGVVLLIVSRRGRR
jgi:hypothetical protein